MNDEQGQVDTSALQQDAQRFAADLERLRLLMAKTPVVVGRDPLQAQLDALDAPDW